MTATVSSLTGLLNQVTPQMTIDAVEAKNWWLTYFQRVTQLGGSNRNWPVRTTGNTSAGSFIEGATWPAAGDQTRTPASEPWGAYWVRIGISRFALEDDRSVNVAEPLLQTELEGAEKDLVNDVEGDVFAGDGTGGAINGLVTLVDSTGTHHGINKATITAWASYEADTMGGALADIDTAIDTLIGPARKGAPTDILANETEFRVIGGLIGANERHIITQVEAGDGSGNVFRGGQTGLWYDNLQVQRVPGFTADTVLIIQRSDWRITVHRDFLLDPFEIENDEIRSTLSLRLNLTCDHLGRQGKLTTF